MPPGGFEVLLEGPESPIIALVIRRCAVEIDDLWLRPP